MLIPSVASKPVFLKESSPDTRGVRIFPPELASVATWRPEDRRVRRGMATRRAAIGLTGSTRGRRSGAMPDMSIATRTASSEQRIECNRGARPTPRRAEHGRPAFQRLSSAYAG